MTTGTNIENAVDLLRRAIAIPSIIGHEAARCIFLQN